MLNSRIIDHYLGFLLFHSAVLHELASVYQLVILAYV